MSAARVRRHRQQPIQYRDLQDRVRSVSALRLVEKTHAMIGKRASNTRARRPRHPTDARRVSARGASVVLIRD